MPSVKSGHNVHILNRANSMRVHFQKSPDGSVKLCAQISIWFKTCFLANNGANTSRL